MKITIISLIVLLWAFAMLLAGCSSNKTQNLLYQDEFKDLAYKSPTIKDYKSEENCRQINIEINII